VDVYLAQHDVQPVTIDKLRYLLNKAIVVFGDRTIGELTSQEIAEWRMGLSLGYRFEATQALRQVLHRAVAWGMLDVNPAKVATTGLYKGSILSCQSWRHAILSTLRRARRRACSSRLRSTRQCAPSPTRRSRTSIAVVRLRLAGQG
jgi:hypothetical protein